MLTSHQTELIDEFDEDRNTEATKTLSSTTPDDTDAVIGIRQAAFTWSKDVSLSETPGGTRRRAFVLKIDEELVFRKGKINLITGPTGTGKTSLLMALLGEESAFTSRGYEDNVDIQPWLLRGNALYPLWPGLVFELPESRRRGVCCARVLGAERHD